MYLIKKYKKLKSIPIPIMRAYSRNRWTVAIPDTEEFETESKYWDDIDWINYICMKGKMWDRSGGKIKI